MTNFEFYFPKTNSDSVYLLRVSNPNYSKYFFKTRIEVENPLKQKNPQ